MFEELLSPLVTPIVLCFSLRHKSMEIVDFFRNFTVDVVGVGDVCSFAQLDVRKRDNKMDDGVNICVIIANVDFFPQSVIVSQIHNKNKNVMKFKISLTFN